LRTHPEIAILGKPWVVRVVEEQNQAEDRELCCSMHACKPHECFVASGVVSLFRSAPGPHELRATQNCRVLSYLQVTKQGPGLFSERQGLAMLLQMTLMSRRKGGSQHRLGIITYAEQHKRLCLQVMLRTQ
jgi:hypothetical protein